MTHVFVIVFGEQDGCKCHFVYWFGWFFLLVTDAENMKNIPKIYVQSYKPLHVPSVISESRYIKGHDLLRFNQMIY